MAGDWIKVQHVTPDKPEIVAIASRLGIDQDAVFGKCMRIWIWADQQTITGKNLSVTVSFLDRLTNCPGFSAALVESGWLIDRNFRLSIPNFDRHNGQTAKNRALTKDRMLRHRYATDVTESSLEKRREEKRRKKKPPTPFQGELFLEFEKAWNAYPGDRGSAKADFDAFRRICVSEAEAVLPRLLPAIQLEIEHKAARKRQTGFAPAWKGFRKWLKERCWEQEFGEIETTSEGSLQPDFVPGRAP